jgi:GTP cyclohydrolase II
MAPNCAAKQETRPVRALFPKIYSFSDPLCPTCDCGDQRRLALALLEDLGGGIILYLAQEARLGLANKMRTYQSQDDGLDTFDANTHTRLR